MANIFVRARPWLENTFRPGGVVLAYHRITDFEENPNNTCVSPRRFREHLEVLRKFARFSHLDEIVQQGNAGKRPACRVALTFDDGYTDNLVTAKPILEEFECPGTVYVTTGPIETGAAFYWDTLDVVFLQTPRLPESLELYIAGERHSWKVGSGARARVELYQAVVRVINPLRPSVRDTLVEEICRWAGPGLDATRRDRLTMTADQLVSLTSDGLVTVGAHCITHPWLPSLSPEEQGEELSGSRRQLEDIVGKPVRSVAYPYGQMTQETPAISREQGFTSGCTTEQAAIRSVLDPLLIPRIVVFDLDGDQFENMLREWVFGFRGSNGPAWLANKITHRLGTRHGGRGPRSASAGVASPSGADPEEAESAKLSSPPRRGSRMVAL